LEFLEDKGEFISARTLERDLKQLKEYLGFDLIYKKNQGYFIAFSKSSEAELLERFDEVVKILNLTSDNSKAVKYILNTTPVMSGIDLLPELFDSFKEKSILSFQYKKFNEVLSQDLSTTAIRNVIPLWLKEHNGRWYLIALPINSLDIRVFGIDRIHNIEKLALYDTSLITEAVQKQVDVYKYMIGINKPTFNDLTPHKIELAISDNYIDYCKTKPIHETQKITNTRVGNYTIVEYILIPNIDLFKLIVSELGDIKLIGSVKVKKYMQKEYKHLMKKILE
jgi:predicted DNA-binding transcriptional regulator YafY